MNSLSLGRRFIKNKRDLSGFSLRNTTDQTERLRLKLRILVVDDVAEIRLVLRFFFNRIGADVLLAECANEAIRIAMDQSPDLIFMDMQLHNIDGYVATKQLRQKGFSAPIIALTGNASSDDREKCIEAGCSDYVSKPFNHEHLLAIVHNHTQKNAIKKPQNPILNAATF